MKIVSDAECWHWLESNLGKEYSRHAEDAQRVSTAISQLLTRQQAQYAGCAIYQLPIDTGKKTGLARIVSRSIDTDQVGLFWITDWDIFPSSQNIALFEGYRKSLGESRLIHDAPGHIFEQSDVSHLECLLDLALYFYWDATLFSGSGSVVVRVSHDEWVSIRSKDSTDLKRFQTEFERLGFLRKERENF
jgi:hypothetical protein